MFGCLWLVPYCQCRIPITNCLIIQPVSGTDIPPTLLCNSYLIMAAQYEAYNIGMWIKILSKETEYQRCSHVCISDMMNTISTINYLKSFIYKTINLIMSSNGIISTPTSKGHLLICYRCNVINSPFNIYM